MKRSVLTSDSRFSQRLETSQLLSARLRGFKRESHIRTYHNFKGMLKMFFGLDWFTAFIKISFEIVFSIVTAIPATIAWNCVVPRYLKAFIPTLYQHFPYWHVVAIILVVNIHWSIN